MADGAPEAPPKVDPSLAARPQSSIGTEASGEAETHAAAVAVVPQFADLLAEARAPEGPAHSTAAPVPTANASADAATTRRIGPYEVLGELGSGGMAVVYKALQPALGRLVAIKELRAEYVNDRQIATRFEREAASLATLRHTNIVHVYDFIRDRESAHIVMEFVDGIDLFDVLASVERVPEEVAAILAAQVAEGLEYAHFFGIVHRDIKPSNILVSKKGEVKIMDFGIARDPGKSELTQVGLALGTPAYMAPEQIRGDRIDFRTDIFALGIVLYEMLAGTKPWTEEEHRAVTVRVLDEPHMPLHLRVPGISPEISRIVDKCLEKTPSRRYRSTHELRRELEAYVHRAVPIDPRERLVAFLRNRNFITEAEADNLISHDVRADRAMRRRDACIPMPPFAELVEPVAIAHGIGLIGILVAALLAVFDATGTPLPKTRPEVRAVAASTTSLVDERQMAEEVEKRARALVREGRAREGSREASGVAEGGAASARAGGEPSGRLVVLVDPWARVYVDGTLYDTTPFAEPIRLAPGSHTIGLRNPFFAPIDRVVEVSADERTVLRATLLPRDDDE